MRARILLAATAFALACQAEEPQVDVTAYVGAKYEQADPELTRRNAWAVLEAAFPTLLAPGPRVEEPEMDSSAPVAHPPRTPAELDELVEAIRAGAIDDLAGPARRIAAADARVWPHVRTLLLAERKAPKGDYRSLLDAIGGDVPNRYGHFARAWKKAHGYRVELSTDWFEDLLALPRARISSMLTAVYRDCVLTTALLRAAAKAGRTPERTRTVIETLLDAAYVHDGTFRDEVGRAIQAVGDEAVPHLLLAAQRPEGKRDGDPEVRQAEYAQIQLDKMDRLHPARAVAAVREDPRLLAALLDAYAVAKPGEAAGVLLDWVDARSVGVRSSARAAFEAYVTGPMPKSVSRTVRLLGGGTGRARAYLSYRQRATLAIRERLQAEAPVLLEPECELQREDGSTDETCVSAPARQTRVYFAWLDLRREATETARVEAALSADDPRTTTEMLDRLLAVNPDLGHVDRLVPFYREVADRAHADGDHARAAQLWRKAATLLRSSDAETASALRVRALLAEASVSDLDPRGRQMLLQTARELAPDDPEVTAALAHLRAAPDEDSAPPLADRIRLYGGIGLLALALLCAMALGAPLRRWAFAPPAHQR